MSILKFQVCLFVYVLSLMYFVFCLKVWLCMYCCLCTLYFVTFDWGLTAYNFILISQATNSARKCQFWILINKKCNRVLFVCVCTVVNVLRNAYIPDRTDDNDIIFSARNSRNSRHSGYTVHIYTFHSWQHRQRSIKNFQNGPHPPLINFFFSSQRKIKKFKKIKLNCKTANNFRS